MDHFCVATTQEHENVLTVLLSMDFFRPCHTKLYGKLLQRISQYHVALQTHHSRDAVTSPDNNNTTNNKEFAQSKSILD
jgi:hypothetical protein